MAGPFTLKPLPYAKNALEPVISGETLGFHHGKHHKKYVDTLNELVTGGKYAAMPLEEIVRATHGATDDKEKKIFNNAAQVWNHDFLWHSMSPEKAEPSGALAAAIAREFGDVTKLTEAFAKAGAEQFGSGWAWLVSKGGRLSIEKTSNAENPMAKGVNCLLTMDVWEHAYYLDYQNDRPKYLKAALGKLLNWEFAARNLAQEDHVVRAAAE